MNGFVLLCAALVALLIVASVVCVITGHWVFAVLFFLSAGATGSNMR